MLCAIAVSYFLLGPPDTPSSIVCITFYCLLYWIPHFWTWSSVGTARRAGPVSIWLEGQSKLTVFVSCCCGLRRRGTYLWLMPSGILFCTGDRPDLSCLVGILDGGHGFCCNSRHQKPGSVYSSQDSLPGKLFCSLLVIFVQKCTN